MAAGGALWALAFDDGADARAATTKQDWRDARDAGRVKTWTGAGLVGAGLVLGAIATWKLGWALDEGPRDRVVVEALVDRRNAGVSIRWEWE